MLIKQWLVRFGVNFAEDIEPRLPIWVEELSDITPAKLLPLFQRAMRTCKFFPRIAEILEPIETSERSAAPTAAEEAWEVVLDLRRVCWNPDMPGPFSRAFAKLSERVQHAARAGGVFREVSHPDQLHVWGKKNFVESFIAWGELEKDKHLLPEGEIKNLLADFSETKSLPAPEVCFEDLHKRGLQYAEECKVLSAWKRAADALPEFDAETRAEIEADLSGYGKRFKTAMEKRQADRVASIPEQQVVET
jgi:hypothetical protein